MRPAALLAALLFATPMPWRRRIWCLLGGTALLQVAILSVLAFCLWRESMELLLVSTSEETKSVATAVQDGLAQYSGLVFPVAIWLLLCVRPGGSPRAPSPFSTPVSNTVTSAPAVAKQT
jgi:hypothetical protein